MSAVRKIAKNTGVLFISQIITFILGFFITMYTARYLGVNGYGILALALSITGIFGICADLGLGTLMVRDISRNNFLADKYISNIALMKIFLSFLTFGLIALVVNIFGYNEVIKNA